MIALLEKRGISLDESAMKYLKVSDAIAREQIRNGEYPHITFRHLLQHSAGFGTSFDPWSRQEVATAFKSKMPTTAKENLEYGLRRPLLERPGEKFDYSNFGYLLLGRLIEDLSGSSYSDYVQQTVFKPLGVGGWLIRSSRRETQHPNECVYYEEPANLYTSRFPQDGNKKVPNMYGGEAFEEAAAFGGWVSNSEALASFASAIGNSRIRRVLSAKGLSEIVARPSYAGTDGQYKGLGLDIEAPFGTSHLAFRHGGVLYGASSWFSSNFAGVTMTLVLNKGVVGKSLGWECHQDLMNAICAKDWSSEVRGGRPLGLPQD
jgi:N-acyl-D-amino-acid deacylase